MDNQETLLTIAEIAVAFVGFTGIVIVLGEKRDSYSLLRIHTLLRGSLSALFCSFVPIVVRQFEIAEPSVWRISIGIIGAIMILNMSMFWWRSRGAGMPKTQVVNFGIGILVVTTSMLTAVGIFHNAALMVILALLWQLFIASQNFILLLLDGVSDDA